MTQNDLKKCDWVSVFGDNFYFIEAKDVNNASRRKRQRNEAIEKFDVTIPYYIKAYPIMIDMNFFVIMNFRNSRITRASNKAKEFYFKEKFNADYIETNCLEFN